MRNAYGDFSQYYDMLGWSAFARNSAARLQSFFKLRGEMPGTVLDLACGTGELEKALAKSGIRFTGVDASPGMIHQAKLKLPKSQFLVADAARVRLERQFDMALFLFDSANHMNSLAHLTRVFRNARRHLRPGGYFVFDFLTDLGLEEWEQINIRRDKNYTLFYYGHYYPDRLLADVFIEAFIKKGQGYRRIFQKIVEKTYPASDIIESLKTSGFEKLMVSPYDLGDRIEEAGRLWFVCS